MSDRLYSNLWYRVEDLRPRLRSHAELHRHHYRGQLWYVLQDQANERYHRFSPGAYNVISLMDGRRTVHEIWNHALESHGDDAPTQDQTIQLLGQLHSADVLLCDINPDTAEVLERRAKQRRSKWLQQIMSPLFWRFPLFDPERLLERWMPFVRPLTHPLAAVLWLGVVVAGVALAVMHWTDLSEDVTDRVLSAHNLLLLWLIFPVFKLLHEFGHAFAVKRYGGEVHEMGLMLLVLTPLPYVDASAASAFRSRRQRILVGAAGMMVETFLASIALFLWLNVEPGLVRSVLFNVMFIAGVSTVLFNINPLLRFDGYYILSDVIEIPNLRSRSTRYLAYLCERHILGRKDAEAPPSTVGERYWFFCYSIASFVYRIFILTAIILFIASQLFFIGVALAIWAVIAWVVLPLFKIVKYILTSPRLRKVRRRAVGVSAGIVGAALLLICGVPAPLRSTTEGVLWIPDEAIVRAGVDGYAHRLLATPGSAVSPGDPLVEIRDDLLDTELEVHRAALDEAKARFDEAWTRDRAAAQIAREEVVEREEQLALIEKKLEERTLRARAAGIFVVPQAVDLVDRFVQRGTVLAYVLNLDTLTARVVVPQESVDLVRKSTRAVEVRLAEEIGEPLTALLLREVPGGSEELPSAALGTSGGGEFATDPYDQRGVRTIQRVFQFDLELPAPSGVVNVGGRVHARFDHGWEPLAKRWYRSLRRLFMSRFDV